jgi:hypothetical protein
MIKTPFKNKNVKNSNTHIHRNIYVNESVLIFIINSLQIQFLFWCFFTVENISPPAGRFTSKLGDVYLASFNC